MPTDYLSLQSALNNAVNLADNAVLNNNEGLNSVAVIRNNITELGNTIGSLANNANLANSSSVQAR